jgi:hypothetical protein
VQCVFVWQCFSYIFNTLLYDIYASVPKIANKNLKLNTNQVFINFNAFIILFFIFSIQIFWGVNSILWKKSGAHWKEGMPTKNVFFSQKGKSINSRVTHKKMTPGRLNVCFEQSDGIVLFI